MYIYRTAHQSGQILQREFPAWPHSLWGHRAVLVWTYTIFSSWAAPQPWWFPSTRVCLVVCFSEQTFTFLIHRPLEEGWGHEGDWCDPFFVEGFLVALFHHRIWNQRSPRSLFFSSHLAEAEFWNWNKGWKTRGLTSDAIIKHISHYGSRYVCKRVTNPTY